MIKPTIKISPAQLKALMARQDAKTPAQPAQPPPGMPPMGGAPPMMPGMSPPMPPMPPSTPPPMPGMSELPMSPMSTGIAEAQGAWEQIQGLGAQLWKSMMKHTPGLTGDPEHAFIMEYMKFGQDPATIRDPDVAQFMQSVQQMVRPETPQSSLLQEAMQNVQLSSAGGPGQSIPQLGTGLPAASEPAGGAGGPAGLIPPGPGPGINLQG